MFHSFDTDIATVFGVDQAILITNFQYWIRHNRAYNINFKEGHTWTFNSVKAMCKLFPYYSTRQIRTIMDKLIDSEILIKGNFNSKGYDKTAWYAFKNEVFWIDQEGKPLTNGKFSHLSELTKANDEIDKANCQNWQMDLSELTKPIVKVDEPIPDIKLTDSKQDAFISPSIEIDGVPSENAEDLSGKKSRSKKPPRSAAPPKEQKPKKVPFKYYSKFIDMYWQWLIDAEENPPKIDVIAGAAANKIIDYLKTVVRVKSERNNLGLDDEGVALGVIEAWGLILGNWKVLEKYYQDRTKLAEINTNIQNILIQIKNGSPKNVKSNSTTQGGGGASFGGVMSAINKRFNKSQ